MHVTLSLKDGGGVEGREEENRKTYKDRKREREEGQEDRVGSYLTECMHYCITAVPGTRALVWLLMVADGGGMERPLGH